MEKEVQFLYCIGMQSRAACRGFGLIVRAVSSSGMADAEAVTLRLILLVHTDDLTNAKG